ncbi:hypothetical protein ACFSPU_06020 [Haoranjiania flava]|uniref:Lipoprotein n=1 Tax=Haoranjiania flava TaxID=1856322 RepID=A0AAE3IRX2_9BACT|nr:hypothetical protein [Haoranjiania flava]MCU7695281.1 hypothetical protein [Haoranjiania flava]
MNLKKFLIVNILSFACINTNDKAISLSNIKDVYYIDSSNYIEIINHSKNIVYYYISLDFYQDSVYKELITDIANPFSKATAIKTLNSDEKKYYLFDLKKFSRNYDNLYEFEKYRLRVIYGRNFNNITSEYYSPSFKIKK